MQINQYFDRVVYLNTAQRVDRDLRIKHELKSANVNAQRFEAIPHARASMSFNLSCVAILNEFLNSTDQRLFVFEDDARFLDNASSIIDRSINDLAALNDFDLFYLGCNLFDFRFEKTTPNLFRVFGAWTTHAVGYSRDAAKKIVAGFKPDLDIYDNYLCRDFVPSNLCYVANPIAVVQRYDYSDIENRYTDYNESWNLTRARMKKLSR